MIFFDFSSPKYVLLWFIPMIDLHWIIPQSSSDDNLNTGGKFLIIFIFLQNKKNKLFR